MTLQRYRINNCADIADDKGGYCLSEDVAVLEESKWISVFDRLPEEGGQYDCVLHGVYGSEMIEFSAADADEKSRWWDGIVHSNNPNDGSQEAIERTTTYHTVTHWLDKPDYPEPLDTHELYLKIKHHPL